MADTFKGIITADGKKRQLPYGSVLETPVSDKTLSADGAFADAKVTGDRFKEVNAETDSLKEDLSNKITKFYASNQGEINLRDSNDGKIMDMMLYGRSEQKQYSGKNLINSDEYYSKYKQSDGTYKGTANDFNRILIPINKYIGTQITVSCKVTVPPNTTYILIEATINGTVTKGSRIESGKSGVIAVTISPKTESDIIKITYGSGGGGIIVVSEFQIEKGSEVTPYEPYTGGQPSPSPDYPQEIKSVVNPTVKVSSEDETESQTVTLPYTLNAIPVNSGGNVTIDGQQYIADYVDVERGKLIRMVDSSKLDNTQSIVNKTEWLLAESQEIDLTTEEITAFKALTTYYPTTNISVNSEQLDGYTAFNYPISMANGWNYVKKQLNDNRDYIYDMDIQSAEAYVNSEYAVALTELEV